MPCLSPLQTFKKYQKDDISNYVFMERLFFVGFFFLYDKNKAHNVLYRKLYQSSYIIPVTFEYLQT